jgi:hypothetical protein
MKAHAIVIVLAVALAALPVASGEDEETPIQVEVESECTPTEEVTKEKEEAPEETAETVRHKSGITLKFVDGKTVLFLDGTKVSGERLLVDRSGKITLSGDILLQTGADASAKRVTVSFEDVDVRDAVAEIAKQAGVTITVDEAVKGKVTLSVKDMPWMEALRAVAGATKSFVWRDAKGAYRLAKFVWSYQQPDLLKRGVWYGYGVAKPGKLGTTSREAQTALRWLAAAGSTEDLTTSLRKAAKALRAAGLEKEAKAAEEEMKRRITAAAAARSALALLGTSDTKRMATSIEGLRAEVAALRQEVRELTELVKALAEK